LQVEDAWDLGYSCRRKCRSRGRPRPKVKNTMQSLKRIVVAPVVAVCMATTSCTLIPSSGPSAIKIASEAKAVDAPYILINVTQSVAAILESAGERPLSVAFGSARRGSSSRIGVGDVVTVSIWEASSDGLFASGTGRQGGTQIPEQPVSEKGTISVPYAGVIQAANRTPDEVKAAIENALKTMAIEPQVLVNVVKNISNTVTVTGEVASSGRIPLTLGGDKLLDVIATAGGPRVESHQLAVQITRGSRTETIPMERLISDPRENIYVQPGDVITLIRQPRSFTVFGAATANASVQFDESQLYLNQALAKVGGLNDERADAKGVFIYRSEPVELVRRIVPSAKPMRPDGTVNVIYQVDLKDPSGFFLLKSFKVSNRDLIYIANSSLAEVRKFSTLVSTTATPVVQGVAVMSNLNDLGQ
jgi:polysaccharide export outer membrane protein